MSLLHKRHGTEQLSHSTTLWTWAMKEWNHRKAVPPTTNPASLSRRTSWSMVSKAAERSRSINRVTLLVSLPVKVIVGRPRQSPYENPDWNTIEMNPENPFHPVALEVARPQPSPTPCPIKGSLLLVGVTAAMTSSAYHGYAGTHLPIAEQEVGLQEVELCI